MTDHPVKLNRRSVLRNGWLALLGTGVVSRLEGPAQAQTRATDGSPLDTGTSEIKPVIERYEVELRNLNRVYALPGSALRRRKLEKFYADQQQLLEKANFDGLSQAGKVDYLLLRERLRREEGQLALEAKLDAETAALIPFQQTIVDFEEARRRMETNEPQRSAAAVAKLTADIAAARTSESVFKTNPAGLHRAAVRLSQLRNFFRSWFNFYDLYDPKFSWWVAAEYKKADEALDSLAQSLHKASGVPGPLDPGPAQGGRGGRGNTPPADAGGRGPAPARTGEAMGSNEELSGIGPVGNQALIDALKAAMIPYTPDELIQIANREFAWCDKEMLRASNEMGFGGDWRKALEAVKNKYVKPGQMIYLVRDLAREAEAFLEKRELVTLPPMLKEDYWEEAMTPQRQLINPFFTGGATIQVSSPASSMTFREKMESMRGNNIYFARATVFHELVPGHHMQGYMTQRYRAYRSLFGTPFWTEGSRSIGRCCSGISASPTRPSSASARSCGGCIVARASSSR